MQTPRWHVPWGLRLQIYETRVRPPGAIPDMLPSSASAPTLNAAPSLEELAYYYGTDKSHDDHKYTDCYAALFDPIRHSARNITEIGLAQGQSLQVWHGLLPSAAPTRRPAPEQLLLLTGA